MNVFFSAIELLAVHCAQRSHHKSFPDPEIIPIIHLSKIHEMTTIESLRHVVKRFIDQVFFSKEYGIQLYPTIWISKEVET
jgi:nucleolar complex protein 2